MSQKLLILMLDPRREHHRRVRELVATRSGRRPEVQVVVPMRVRGLQWVASDEDEARERATERAEATGRTLTPVAAVEAAEAGDIDPVMAVEDALRTFAADEIVVVGTPDHARLDDELERFDLPVSYLDLPTVDGGAVPDHAGPGVVASGRSEATPVLAFLVTMTIVLGVAGLIALGAWLVVSLI